MMDKTEELRQYACAQQLKFFQLWEAALRADRPELECEHYRKTCASWANKVNELDAQVKQHKETTTNGNKESRHDSA